MRCNQLDKYTPNQLNHTRYILFFFRYSYSKVLHSQFCPLSKEESWKKKLIRRTSLIYRSLLSNVWDKLDDTLYLNMNKWSGTYTYENINYVDCSQIRDIEVYILQGFEETIWWVRTILLWKKANRYEHRTSHIEIQWHSFEMLASKRKEKEKKKWKTERGK